MKLLTLKTLTLSTALLSASALAQSDWGSTFAGKPATPYVPTAEEKEAARRAEAEEAARRAKEFTDEEAADTALFSCNHWSTLDGRWRAKDGVVLAILPSYESVNVYQWRDDWWISSHEGYNVERVSFTSHEDERSTSIEFETKITDVVPRLWKLERSGDMAGYLKKMSPITRNRVDSFDCKLVQKGFKDSEELNIALAIYTEKWLAHKQTRKAESLARDQARQAEEEARRKEKENGLF